MFDSHVWCRLLRAGPICLTAALALAACGPSGPGSPSATSAAPTAAARPAPTTAPAAAGAPTTAAAAAAQPTAAGSTAVELKMAAFSPTALAFLPYLVAQKRGLFQSVGLTIQSTAFNDPPTAVNSIGKDFDFGAGLSPQVVINAFSSGRKDLRVIGVSSNTSTIVFVVPKDSTVQTPADLKGKKVAIAVAGGVCHGFAADMVKEAGLQPDRDVELIPGAPTGFVGLWTATKSGQFAATCLIPPISSQAVVTDGGRIIYDSARKVSAWAESVIITTTDVSQSKKDAFTRLLTAWRQGADWVVDNQEEAGRIWAEAANLDPQIGVATVSALPKDAWSPRIKDDALMNVQKQMIDLGQLKEPVDTQTLLDRSFLPADLRGT